MPDLTPAQPMPEPFAKPNLTPADIAQLDQAFAAGNRDLDHMVAVVRRDIADHGTTIAAAMFTASLQGAGLHPDYLASIAGLAITRLAQETP